MLGSVILGIGVYFLVPRRESYGAAMLPAASGAITAVVWAGLTWASWKFDGTWIWVVSLAAGCVGSAAAGLLLARRREAADDRLFQTLVKSER